MAPPVRPPLGYSKPPRTDFSSNSDVSNDEHDFDRSHIYPAGSRPVADAALSPLSSDNDDNDDDDDDDDDFSYVIDQMSFTSTNTPTDSQQQPNLKEINSLIRQHYPSISSTTHSTVNSTLTSSSATANVSFPDPNKITRL